MKPSEVFLDRVEALMGSRPAAWRPVTGGYSIAERWSLDLDDGRKVFGKLATTDDIARRLRDEHRNMAAIDADFRCEIVAYEEHDRPLLVVEDLSHGRWPPPWEPGDVERVLEIVERVAATAPPAHVPSTETYRNMFTGWQWMGFDPSGFLSLDIGSRTWLDECLPTLIEAEQSVVLEGEDLVHADAWSSNICLLRDRTVLVDWNNASRGNGEFDRFAWLPSLRLEGGPLPEEVAPGIGHWAAALSGYFAVSAGQPAPEGAPTVRPWQKRQGRIAIPWACRELGLPQPDVLYARNEIPLVDSDLGAGRIDEGEWHRRIEEVLIDAYLASDDPRGQSGKSGDEDEWRWARELVLEVFPSRASFLDVGCANGYLMESVERWGAERGIEVEPYGLDISWRIASLARFRLPEWAERIFVGNAIDWTPPMRFDVVQIGLDEVPPTRRRELVDRVLREFLEPGGRLVLRPNRVGDAYGDPAELLEDIGLRPGGIIERSHPSKSELRRTAWIQAPVG
ncbi:MAG: class I SAM-dependent methyltransferase [Actinomycetota bacterium]